MLVQRFARNPAGRDFAVGDIHGNFTRLAAALAAIGFDGSRDRLFAPGDLVDRGPESDQVLQWLEQPWFHAARGNHEEMAINAADGRYDVRNYAANGGAWFIAMTQPERRMYADAFASLPLAMEVETEHGLVGLIHADCPVPRWQDLEAALTGASGADFQFLAQWGQDRVKSLWDGGVEGVSAVVVGHTVVQRYSSLGNVLFIDTGAGFKGGDFTILDLATLAPAYPVRPR